MSDDATPHGPDRRSVLKKAGVAGAAIWAAPVVTSLTSPVYAAGSPPPSGATGCVVLEQAATVSVQVVSYGACNTLGFGLQAPQTIEVCRPCGPGSSAVLGSFPTGTDLVFYLDDPADCCGCPERYACGDSDNARVTKESATSYLVEFRDNGCACGTSTISQGTNLAARVTLS